MSAIARVYVNLIRKGEREIEDVPENLKVEVQQLLNQGEEDID